MPEARPRPFGVGIAFVVPSTTVAGMPGWPLRVRRAGRVTDSYRYGSVLNVSSADALFSTVPDSGCIHLAQQLDRPGQAALGRRVGGRDEQRRVGHPPAPASR